MSGIREIIEWVERELILDPTKTVDKEFESISRIFERDNRSPLADILRDDTPEFLDFLGSRLSELRDEPEADEDIGELESRIESLERSITDVLSRSGEALVNILGTPIRLLDGLLPKT